MFQLVRFVLFFIFLFLSLYFAWANTGIGLSEKDYNRLSLPIEIKDISLGFSRKQGNIVGIQPYLYTADYSTPERLYRKLELYMEKAKSSGYLKSDTVVVFPEHIGTLLFLMNEKASIYSEKEIDGVKPTLIYSNFHRFTWNFLASGWGGEKSFRALYLMKSEAVKNSYYAIFSKLALFYKVNILAGSIILPSPKVENKQIAIGGSDLGNTGFYFNSNGEVENIVFKKKFFYNSEENILQPDTNNTQAIFESKNLPFTFAVLFSKDSLYNDTYTLDSKNVDVLISPATFLQEEKILWQEPGISDTFRKDRSLFVESDKNLSKQELWNKFGIQGKFPNLNNKAFMQVFLRGEFFEFKPIGQSSTGLRYYKTEILEENTKSAIINLWL